VARPDGLCGTKVARPVMPGPGCQALVHHGPKAFYGQPCTGLWTLRPGLCAGSPGTLGPCCQAAVLVLSRTLLPGRVARDPRAMGLGHRPCMHMTVGSGSAWHQSRANRRWPLARRASVRWTQGSIPPAGWLDVHHITAGCTADGWLAGCTRARRQGGHGPRRVSRPPREGGLGKNSAPLPVGGSQGSPSNRGRGSRSSALKT
jgi:hypothetical protein